ncbi:MAG: hypothetical protein JWP30_42 [Homoserinimonas sp.]|nr:hypothetical protein [Homoserinimonas sp.]
MTTSEPLGDGSQPRPADTHAPAASTNFGATGTLPPGPKKLSGLALAALIVGVAAFLFGLIPVFGAIVGVTAVALAVLALSKKQSKGMALTGLILGGVATLVSFGMTVGVGAIVNNASNDRPAAVAEPATPELEESTAPESAEVAEPVEEVAEPAAPAVPVEYMSALNKADSYANMMHMSKAGLFGQLTSEFGEQFSPEAAQYAVDNVQADWNANALAKAKSYQDSMSMSPAAIHDQLTSEYGEQFTGPEADYAIQNLNG